MFQRENEVAFDKQPISLRVMPGVRKDLYLIPNWQKKVRAWLDIFIQEEKEKIVSQGTIDDK
jgi:hypothetical protein